MKIFIMFSLISSFSFASEKDFYCTTPENADLVTIEGQFINISEEGIGNATLIITQSESTLTISCLAFINDDGRYTVACADKDADARAVLKIPHQESGQEGYLLLADYKGKKTSEHIINCERKQEEN